MAEYEPWIITEERPLSDEPTPYDEFSPSVKLNRRLYYKTPENITYPPCGDRTYRQAMERAGGTWCTKQGTYIYDPSAENIRHGETGDWIKTSDPDEVVAHILGGLRHKVYPASTLHSDGSYHNEREAIERKAKECLG